MFRIASILFLRLTSTLGFIPQRQFHHRAIALSARGKGNRDNKMPRGVKKENLPSKICVVCNRPFTWRKKWERCWDEVTTCSKSCNCKRRGLQQEKRSEQEETQIQNDGENHSFSQAGVSRQERKAATKAAKALTRAKREGRAPPGAGQKKCDLCARGVDLLVRCQIDETLKWKLVCGPCWPSVSGGVVDGDAAHPHYRYGGLWKNRIREKAGKHQEETQVVHDDIFEDSADLDLARELNSTDPREM